MYGFCKHTEPLQPTKCNTMEDVVVLKGRVASVSTVKTKNLRVNC